MSWKVLGMWLKYLSITDKKNQIFPKKLTKNTTLVLPFNQVTCLKINPTVK